MFSVHTDLWEKKEEELGAVHQQDLSVMEKVIIASESMASNFQIQSIIAQIVKKLLQFFYFLAYPIYLVYAGVGVRCLTFHMFGLFFRSSLTHLSSCHARGVVKGQKVCVIIKQLLDG